MLKKLLPDWQPKRVLKAAFLALGFVSVGTALALLNTSTGSAALPYGQLHVSGVNLTSATGQVAILHGMSTHGMQWFGQFANAGAYQALKSRGANVIRLAMYTDEGGYLSNPALKNQVFKAADAAIAQDMYVILDWHILHDGNPQTHEAEAKGFFDEASARYGNNPAVLYEICNEPNGNINWSNNVKPYASDIIPVIRAHAPNAVIIVGTTTWSQDVDAAAKDPLPYGNLMYACHFYAGTHGQWLRDRIDTARKMGAPIFISEWGTSAADGNGGVYLDAATQWLSFLKERNMSWCNWSLCDKSESSAALNPGANPNGGWTDNNLSASGKFVFSNF